MRLPMKLLSLASRFAPELLCFDQPANHQNCVALTFDDGPHPEYTPRILDVLSRLEARATFFFQGVNAARWPELVRRAHSAGHQVAAHGVDHVAASTQPARAAAENAISCHAVLCEIAGSHLAPFYRPPYGDITFGALRDLSQRGYRLAFWSYDSRDSFCDTAAAVEGRIARSAPPPGSILLFHDDYAHTVEALPQVIATLRARQLTFVTVAELCHA